MTESTQRLTQRINITSRDQTAVDLLTDATGLPRGRIKDAMNKGAVWLTAKGKTLRLRRATRIPEPGTQLTLHYDTQVLATQAPSAELLDNRGHYSVWYKPHGLLAQGSQWGDHCSLLRQSELQLKRSTYLIHRLDADAAGLMLIGHTPQSAAALSQLFQSRTLEKNYQARVQGTLETGPELILDTSLDGKEAITRITTLSQSNPQQTLLAIRIETGRKHQIRKHLSGIGHPIIGDRLYGSSATNTPLQLLAWRLAFLDPFTRQPVVFELPPHRHLTP